MSSFPVLRTRLPVCFLSPFLDSLPQPFLKCLPCAFAFGLFPSDLLSFVRSSSGSGYLASVSSFPLSSLPCLTVGFFSFSVPLSLPCFSPSFQPGFPCFLSGSKYSAFCLFPFALPGFAPTAVPPVLPFWISPLGSTLSFHFLSSASALASHYSASVSSFPLSSRFRLTVAIRCSSVSFVPSVLPLLSSLVSRALFPVLCT